MIKNIIFDLGNVLITFVPKKFMERFVDDKKRIKTFTSKIILTETWLGLDRGVISVETAQEIMLSKYPEEEQLINLFFQHWLEMFESIQKNVEVLRDLKKAGFKTYILSNFIEEAFEFVISRFDFFKLFDGRVISCYENLVKPEKGIYTTLLEKYGLIPNECIFMDDHSSFLTPAKKLGIHTILVRPETDLRKELRRFQIKI